MGFGPNEHNLMVETNQFPSLFLLLNFDSLFTGKISVETVALKRGAVSKAITISVRKRSRRDRFVEKNRHLKMSEKSLF